MDVFVFVAFEMFVFVVVVFAVVFIAGNKNNIISHVKINQALDN